MQLTYQSQPPHRLCGGLVIAALFVAESVGILSGQIPDAPDAHSESVDVSVNVSVHPPAAQKLWWASDSWLEQDFQMTWAYVRIKNISMTVFKSARFYGEYFDDRGRLCFTGVFSQDSNVDGASGPFEPGAMRTLKVGASVAPAVRAKELRLWFLGGAGERGLSHPELLMPSTILDANYGTGGDFRLSKPSAEPLLPIALVEVTTDRLGVAISVNVIAASDDRASQWARNLVSKLRFAPGTQGGEPTVATSLILIRLLQSNIRLNRPAAPASEDPWVRSYTSAIGDRAGFPFVNLVRLQNEEGAGTFRYFSVGTDWGISVLKWFPNSNGHGTHRDWIIGPENSPLK